MDEQREYPFEFSVVMPVYNTEQYLEEAIESVIEQTIGFEEKIQLILVNNATKDNSGAICERYAERYPNNIDYIVLKENCGPSGARNAGRFYVKGKYVNFMDSDDKWDKNAFAAAEEFWAGNEGKIDCVACRMLFFDGATGKHPLDFRFSKDQIVNIHARYNYLQLHVNSVFFTAQAVESLCFDEEMNHAEDTKYFNEIMLRKGKYGLLGLAIYNYRKRSSSDSLLNTVQKNADYYTEKLRKSLGFFIELSNRKYGRVIPYIQNMVIYALKYRISEQARGSISADVSQEALELMHEYLKNVSDKIILEQKGVYKEHKIFALSLKYGCDVREEIVVDNGEFYIGQQRIFAAKERVNCSLINIEVKNDVLHLDGRINLVLPKSSYEIVVKTNLVHEYPLEVYTLDQSVQKSCLGVKYHEVYGFRVAISMEELRTVQFILRYQGEEILLNVGFWLVTSLSGKLENTYCVIGKYICHYKDCCLFIEENSLRKRIFYERNLSHEIAQKSEPQTLLWRKLILLGKAIHKMFGKKLWLFMDQFSNAGDNAEDLFRYVCAQKNTNIRPVFCVARESDDYKRLKKIGAVIPYDSKIYRLVFAVCDVLISSQTFYNTHNTFYHRTEFLKDLFSHKTVYLQHGVIKDNHADTQSKHKKAVDLFVTTAHKEYESLLREHYGYDESVVKLTGLARYDELYKATFSKGGGSTVLLAPTWRRIAGLEWDENNQRYLYSDDFKKTDFFQFFNRLMNDKRIIMALQQNGYQMELQLHPRIWAQNIDFEENEFVKIQREKSSLEEAVVKTCLLITDYSSVAFDYAFANTPIIYTQFDKDSFYNNHAYTRGYFNYETMGFGPVCYDYESTVQAIVRSIENECVVEEKYVRRVNEFFAFRDDNNCERIYQEILKLTKT